MSFKLVALAEKMFSTFTARLMIKIKKNIKKLNLCHIMNFFTGYVHKGSVYQFSQK